MAYTQKLWFYVVYSRSVRHTPTQTLYSSTAWYGAHDYSTQRKYTKETHTSLLISIWQQPHKHTHTHLVRRPTALSLMHAQSLKPKKMHCSVQCSKRPDNLLAVLRFTQVLQLTWAFIVGPQSSTHHWGRKYVNYTKQNTTIHYKRAAETYICGCIDNYVFSWMESAERSWSVIPKSKHLTVLTMPLEV